MHGQKTIVSFCSSNLLTSSVSQDFAETIIHFMLTDNNSVFLIAIEIQKESRNSEYRYIERISKQSLPLAQALQQDAFCIWMEKGG